MVADIVLAEFSGQGWLVRGEEHIDNLLANMLDPDVSIEVVTCESKSAVNELWWQWNDKEFAHAWLIHPAIMNRARGKPGETFVAFAPWSASIDDTARRAIHAAADAVKAAPGATLTLVRCLMAGVPPMAAQMADMRCGMIEMELAGLGATQLARDTRTVERDSEADRIVLILQK